MSFYRYFDEECETPNAVVENLKKKGVIEPTRQRHFYSAIDLAREKYAETNRHRPDQELKEIFAFVPVGERISLYREVNHRLRGPETESKETCILIVAALCRMDAVQPFTVLYHDGAPFCPFVAYAETGAHMVLREMLEQLSNKIALEKVKGSKEYQSELMEKLTNTYKDQAPAIVLTAVRKHMEALQLILEFAPELEIGQEVIDYSIDEDNEALFRILITHHRSHIMRPNNLCYAIQQEAIRIIQYIFHTLDPATPELQALLTRNTVEQIICAKKSTELWNICCLGQLCNKLYDSEKCNLLHIAIAKGKAKIVVDMIQGFPDLLVKKDQEKRYAIAKLKGGDFSNETERRSTRDKCVAELLKRENRHESRRILQESEGSYALDILSRQNIADIIYFSRRYLIFHETVWLILTMCQFIKLVWIYHHSTQAGTNSSSMRTGFVPKIVRLAQQRTSGTHWNSRMFSWKLSSPTSTSITECQTQQKIVKWTTTRFTPFFGG